MNKTTNTDPAILQHAMICPLSINSDGELECGCTTRVPEAKKK